MNRCKVKTHKKILFSFAKHKQEAKDPKLKMKIISIKLRALWLEWKCERILHGKLFDQGINLL